ncbi:hypothetical protein K470DRAFT_262661 [Piedraia hortae CBS 480.64]|uniref:DUF7905 domain-containing protein n=1 Tax=Piedraia hortae CBS 480.64 TaxID=1314780 RepID=A0A6A7C5T5_9PEZI|nr:hypothetical protein K470DRAFT_262661 [Piedraia hortae CBS 480.64]
MDYERLNALEWNTDGPTVGTASTSSTVGRPQLAPNGKLPGLKQRRPAPSSAATVVNTPTYVSTVGRSHFGNGQKTQRKGKISRRAPELLLSEPDNAAEADWRARLPPKDQILVPEWLLNGNSHHHAIARACGAFVQISNMKANQGNRWLGFWGKSEAVADAKKEIHDWVDKMVTKYKKRKFEKLLSPTPCERERTQIKWDRDVRRQTYRQHPPPDMVHHAIGTFHWPMDEVNPKEVLGPYYEALDYIRMSCKCYIVFKAERNAFSAMGKSANVDDALERIRKACFQIAARQTSCKRMYMRRWPEGEIKSYSVTLMPYNKPLAAQLDPESAVTPRAKFDPGPAAKDITIQANDETYRSGMKIRSAVLRTLHQLHYYRGPITLKVRLGTLLLDQFMPLEHRKAYTMEEYAKMTVQSQFVARVTEELGDRAVEQRILGAFQATQGIIVPMDPMIADLEEVGPTYSVAFILGNVNKEDLQLTINWAEHHDAGANSNEITCTGKRWSRLESETGRATPLVDASFTNLVTGLSWHFDLTGSLPVDKERLPPAFEDFEDSIQLIPHVARAPHTDELFVRYKPYVPIKSVRQSITYSYNLSFTPYVVEFTKFQDRKWIPDKLRGGNPAIYEPRWSINVNSNDWKSNFVKNERLKIGDDSGWSHDVSSWFSPDFKNPSVDGWLVFLKKLKDVEDVVLKTMVEVKEAQRVGGMNVG